MTRIARLRIPGRHIDLKVEQAPGVVMLRVGREYFRLSPATARRLADALHDACEEP